MDPASWEARLLENIVDATMESYCGRLQSQTSPLVGVAPNSIVLKASKFGIMFTCSSLFFCACFILHCREEYSRKPWLFLQQGDTPESKKLAAEYLAVSLVEAMVSGTERTQSISGEETCFLQGS